MMVVEPPEMTELDRVADCWVALAREQRPHESHLLADENREAIRESMARRLVSDGLLVTRAGEGAEDPDRIVGFVSFGPDAGGYEQDVDRGVVENIYVDPAYRGEGRGSELLAAAERRLFESGCDRVSLEVMATNEGARGFYDRMGYVPHRVELEKRPENDNH